MPTGYKWEGDWVIDKNACTDEVCTCHMHRIVSNGCYGGHVQDGWGYAVDAPTSLFKHVWYACVVTLSGCACLSSVCVWGAFG